MTFDRKEFEGPLKHLRALSFVHNLRFVADDGTVEITTPQGRYRFSAEVKRSYLNQNLVNAILSRASRISTRVKSAAKSKHAPSRVVLARYIPTAVGEQFVNAGISFADDAGNVHLRLGSEYNWTVLGKREPARLPEADRTTPATIQLLFQFAIDPDSTTWTVRDLARSAGIGKTKVAELRRQFQRERILQRESGFRMTPEIADRLVSGYGQTLRPKLLLGRYRYPDSSVDEFLARLSEVARTRKAPYALTGGPAAEAIQHYYHGADVPVFLDPAEAGIQRALRLLPDRTGPVVLLKPFGPLVYWREFDGRMAAPPWLVYAELLASGDPRAREAAEELRRGFLQ